MHAWVNNERTTLRWSLRVFWKYTLANCVFLKSTYFHCMFDIPGTFHQRAYPIHAETVVVYLPGRFHFVIDRYLRYVTKFNVITLFVNKKTVYDFLSYYWFHRIERHIYKFLYQYTERWKSILISACSSWYPYFVSCKQRSPHTFFIIDWDIVAKCSWHVIIHQVNYMD